MELLSGVIKSPEEVEFLRRAGKILSQCLEMLVSEAQPGVSGKELDLMAEEFIRDHGCIPAFKGYGPKEKPFPGSICFSRNHVLVHGVPNERDIIKEGDIVSIDCGLSLEGWFADAARLFEVGEVEPIYKEMVQSTREALDAGIKTCVAGKKLGAVSNAIQRSIVKSKFFNVVQFCGHAIGRAMHEEPQVPNFGAIDKGIVLEPGMVFCLEPMLLRYRTTKIGILSDGWTVVTADGTKSTHIEHMVLVTENLPEVLTDKIN